MLEGLHRSPTDAGLSITAWPLATVAVAPLAGRLIGRVPDGLLGAVGLVLMTTGLALLAVLPGEPGNVFVSTLFAGNKVYVLP
ncbi:MAG: hypothetical protein ABI277_05660 [Burkholderiaceae bacterium]